VIIGIVEVQNFLEHDGVIVYMLDFEEEKRNHISVSAMITDKFNQKIGYN
jgi:hypothetical protein